MLRTDRLCPGDLNKRILDATRARTGMRKSSNGMADLPAPEPTSKTLALTLAFR